MSAEYSLARILHAFRQSVGAQLSDTRLSAPQLLRRQPTQQSTPSLRNDLDRNWRERHIHNLLVVKRLSFDERPPETASVARWAIVGSLACRAQRSNCHSK